MIEEVVYKIIDTTTGTVLKTGRTKNPPRRALSYKGYGWWKPYYQLEPYRLIIRQELSDKEYAIYASAVEHMEICRNKTWDFQGGLNKISPLRQAFFGPAERAEIGSLGAKKQPREAKVKGGLLAGARNVRSGQIQQLGLKQGRKNADSGFLKTLRTPEHQKEAFVRMLAKDINYQRKAGIISGQKHVESGWINKLGKEQGRKNVENGHLATLRTPEHQAKAGYLGGLIAGKNHKENKTGIFSIPIDQHRENSRKAGLSAGAARGRAIGNHLRWHTKRDINKPNCEFCRTECRTKTI